MPTFSSKLFNLCKLYYRLLQFFDRLTVYMSKTQYAAGCFKHLDEVIIPEMRITPPLDMSSETLDVLTNTMLAQAQECFWQKAVHGKLKGLI